jgi:tetratricopeptide (TPR) repeat protein
MTPATDQTDPATLAAAEGQAALGRGETATARAKFVEAGEILLKEIGGTRSQADKSTLRFLAATQFYKGGEYGRAQELARKVDAPLLPAKTRDLFPKFQRDVSTRSSQDYRTRMRGKFVNLWQEGKYRQVLDLLKDHPYVYDPGPLTFLRAVLCEDLGLWKAAAGFHAKAIPLAKDGNEFMLMAVGCALAMPGQGRVGEAWEYIHHLREAMPNVVTNLTAGIVTFFRAAKASGNDRLAIHREQLTYFDEGWQAFVALPENKRNHPEMRSIASISFDTASMALMRLGERDWLLRLVEQVLLLDPGTPGPLTVRGMLTYPSAAAVKDFQQAAVLPNPGYAPFLYLAHHAFSEGHFADAIALCERALKGKPGRSVAAQLTCWIAVSQHCQGTSAEEVEKVFQQALAIDVENKHARANYQIFKEIVAEGRSDVGLGWDTRFESELLYPPDVLVNPEAVFRSFPRRSSTIHNTLAAVAN